MRFHPGVENAELSNHFLFQFLQCKASAPTVAENWVEEGGAEAINSEADTLGSRALQVAVHCNFLAVWEFLMEVEVDGTDVNVLNERGVTAAGFAEFCGHWETRDALIRCGASPTVSSASIKCISASLLTGWHHVSTQGFS